MPLKEANLLDIIFSEKLSVINDVSFSRREIDIIVALMNSKDSKKIALLLTLAPKTVDNYLYNLSKRLGVKTRKEILDFIQNSDLLPYFKIYYIILVTYASFEEALNEISKLNNADHFSYSLIYDSSSKNINALFNLLKNHLDLVGIKTEVIFQKQENNISHCLEAIPPLYSIQVTTPPKLDHFLNKIKSQYKNLHTDECLNIQNPTPIRIILIGKKALLDIPTYIADKVHINFLDFIDYYNCFFSILTSLISKPSCDLIISNFNKNFKNICTNIFNENLSISPVIKSPKKPLYPPFLLKNIPKRKILNLTATLVSFCLLLLTMHVFERKIKIGKNPSIISASIISSENAFMSRPTLISKISEKLDSTYKINSIALTGIGGAGKTTLARQYASQQGADIIWEINAESPDALINSFENLGDALAHDEEKQKAFREIKGIADPRERQEKIMTFIKHNLKINSNWLLIYDNVENFKNIRDYFPLDSKIWGKGKIIVTTRNKNIEHSHYINSIINVEELNEKEKKFLFNMILAKGNSYKTFEKDHSWKERFLKEIPPFPLDITIAAYYLKATNIHYNRYLEYLKSNNDKFAATQEYFLKENSQYTNSRYSIIALSVEQLLKTDQDFEELLLFICLLDSQMISKDLLDRLKDKNIIDKFIYNLKKYSLITEESFVNSTTYFSIHRSLQQTILAYLLNTYPYKKKQDIRHVATIFENYINDIVEKEDLSLMRLNLTHCETFLSHNEILDENLKSNLSSQIGKIYYHLGEYPKAQNLLERTLSQKPFIGNENNIRIINNLIYLGNTYYGLGDFKKSKTFFEQSLDLCKKYFTKDPLLTAEPLAYLGNLYRVLGQYERAIFLLKQSLFIYSSHPKNPAKEANSLAFLGIVYKEIGDYKQAQDIFRKALAIYKIQFPDDHIRVAEVWELLGIVARELGDYETAKDNFERSVSIYKNYFSDNNIKVAKLLSQIANVYRLLGNYKKAQELLEHSIKIYKKHYPATHIKFARILGYLGIVYRELKNYGKAKAIFEQALNIYNKNFFPDYIKSAWILRSLGEVYLLEHNFEKAEILINRALKIFESNHHPEYKSFESLAELNLQRFKLLSSKGNNSQQLVEFRNQALSYLKKALKIVLTHFPKDSNHAIRIKYKIDEINNGT